MKTILRTLRMVSFLLLCCLLVACIFRRSEQPSSTLDFEAGIKFLASDLAVQLERSSVGNVLNKVIVNPLTQQKQLKRIVIDPFFDSDSGYPVKVNPRIKAIISEELDRRFAVSGEMAPENLEISEYVLTGMVSLAEKVGGKTRNYKVYAAVFEKSSGVVHASSTVEVSNFDTTPMDIYKDSPVYLKGETYQHQVESVQKQPRENVNDQYHENLAAKSLQVKGDMLYEKRDYDNSLNYYNKAARATDKPSMEILNGLFTNLVKQGRLAEAENVYGELLQLSLAEYNGISTKITFGPNSTAPIASKADINMIFIRQIAKFVAGNPACQVTIVGHCSRSGAETYNDQLSLQRAQAIQRLMGSLDPEILARTEIIGRGYRDNIVGTGRDDLTDEIDRRVEFKFNQCVR